MRDHPETKLLLEGAHRAITEQVIPRLDGDARAAALMVGRVLVVVAERVSTDALDFEMIDRGDLLDELSQAAMLLNTPPEEARTIYGGTKAAIHHLERELSSAIRRGEFDADDERQAALRGFLMAVTRAKLSENNPKVLEQIDQERDCS